LPVIADLNAADYAGKCPPVVEPATRQYDETAAAAVTEKPSATGDAPVLKRSMDLKEIPDLLRVGRALVVAGDIPTARDVLKRAAEAGDANAALELGGTYDPLVKKAVTPQSPVASISPYQDSAVLCCDMNVTRSDVSMARAWYEKAQQLGSTEATERLARLEKFDKLPETRRPRR